MKTYPAVLIGRLGVNLNLKGKGIGSELMGYLKGWLVDSDNKADCRYLVVDAYNTPDVVAYYLRNAFSFMFSSEEQEKAYLKLSSEDKLETRFMLFDLIVLNIER